MTRKTKTTDLSAKRNFTKQVQLRLDLYRNTLAARKGAVKKFQQYAKYNLPNTKARLIKEKNWVRVTEGKIATLKKLIAKRYKNGQIFQVK